MKTKEKEEATLAEFNWDNEDDFFGQKEEEIAPPPPVSNIKEVESTDEDDTEEVEEEDDFFDIEEEEDTSEKKSSSYSEIYKKLKSEGIMTVDSESDEIDEEEFIELQEKELNLRVEEAFEEFANELDDDAKAFLKFKKEGGSTNEFFRLYTAMMEVPTPKEGNDRSHESFLKYYYTTVENMDEEDVEDKIEWLKESGKLEKYSLKFHNELEEETSKKTEEAVKRQSENVKKQEEARKALVNDLKDMISTSDSIKDWKLSPKDKKELPGYMTKGVVKSGTQVLTQLQADLQEAFKDKEKLILLAKILHDDFDTTGIKESAKTEVIRETKKTLKTGKSTRSRSKGLAEFF